MLKGTVWPGYVAIYHAVFVAPLNDPDLALRILLAKSCLRPAHKYDWPLTCSSHRVTVTLTAYVLLHAHILICGNTPTYAPFTDPRTACKWQGYVNDQQRMQSDFQAAMLKMSLLGQDQSALTDCSDVIENAPPLPQPATYFPDNFTVADVNQTVRLFAFGPAITTPS